MLYAFQEFLASLWGTFAWFIFGAGAATYVVLTGIVISGKSRLRAMGRGLRPPGSWSGPFGTPKLLRRGLLTGFLAYLSGFGVLIAFFYLPIWWQPAIDVRDRFEGKPVMLAYPRSQTVPYHLELTMEHGVCDVLRVTGTGTIERLFSAGGGTFTDRLPAGAKLQLAPRPGAAGRYHIRVGPPQGLYTLLAGNPDRLLRVQVTARSAEPLR